MRSSTTAEYTAGTLNSVCARYVLLNVWFMEDDDSWMGGRPYATKPMRTIRISVKSFALQEIYARLRECCENLTEHSSGGRSNVVFLEPCALHATLCRLVLHKGIPHKSRAHILGHQQGDTGIDPDHVAVVPIGQRVKCVHEPVLAPRRGIAIFDRP